MHIYKDMSQWKVPKLRPHRCPSQEELKDDFTQRGEQMALSDEDAVLIEQTLTRNHSSIQRMKRIRIFVHPRRKAA